MLNGQDMSTGECQVCHSTGVEAFVEIPRVPVFCNVLLETQAEALHAPTGQIRLGFCKNCGHIYNLSFGPQWMSYSQAYENSLHFSPRFQQYAEGLARRLIDQYDLHEKHIIEIGCGKGEFLNLMCELGDNQGVGFDPSFEPDRAGLENAGRIKFIQDVYSSKYADYQADFLCSRHVLEHIQHPGEFLQEIRQSIGNERTVIYFEVPNVLYTLRDMGIWDLLYEHVSYFSSRSLAFLFTVNGFRVLNLSRAYLDQFLYIEALPETKGKSAAISIPGDAEEVEALVMAFANNYQKKVATWRARMEQLADTQQRVVVWGAGSKGVMFLNTLSTQNRVGYAVDINPLKQGRFIPGSGQKVVPPNFLRDYHPDVIILMNPIYEEEVQRTVRNLGIAPLFLKA